MGGLDRLKNVFGHLVSGSSNIVNSPAAKMADIEGTLAKGVEEGKVPHAVVYATNADGITLPLSSHRSVASA